MINHATLYILTTVKKFEYGECKTKFYIFAVICLEYLSALTDLSSQYVDCYSNLLSSRNLKIQMFLSNCSPFHSVFYVLFQLFMLLSQQLGSG